MDNTTSFISRMIEGLKGGTVLKPTVTPESLSSFILEKDIDIIRSKSDSYNGISDSNLEYLFNPSIKSTVDNFRTGNHSSKTDKKPSKKRERDRYDHEFDKYKKPRTEFNENEPVEPENKTLVSNLENINVKYIPTNYRNISDNFNIHPGGASSDTPNQDKFNIHPGRASSDTPNQDNVTSTNSGIKSDLLSQTLIERLQRNEISKKTSQTTITINIGKITVRAVNNSDSYRSIGNESRQSKKLSLNDYLRKRSEKEGQK